MRKLLMIVLVLLMGCTDKNTHLDLTNNECKTNWALCSVFSDKSYQYSFEKKIKIAILDSGINGDHPELTGLIRKSYNAINPGQKILDSYGHGTAIAGMISAKPNEYIIQGISQSVYLYDVKVLNDKGGGEIEDVVDGIEWSINNNVDIINLSFGFQKDNQALREAILKATTHGIIIVAAAGNNLGLYTDYPAKYEEVISISSISENLKVDPFAGKGKVDYVAPGVKIPILTNGEDKVRYVNGTSFSTAIATGIIANILEQSEKPLSLTDIKEKLNKTSIDLGEKGKDTTYGNGLIQLPNNN
ncbi:MAG: S8 family peptidase [Bacillota bacterium]